VKLERVRSPPKTLPPARSRRSVYRVTYPIGGLPPARLVMIRTARVFGRRLMLGEERERDERRRDSWFNMLASGEWRHAEQDRAAMPLTIDVPPIHSTELFVPVDEGDNTPLPIDAARLLAPQVLGASARELPLDTERAVASASTTATLVSPRLFWSAVAIAASCSSDSSSVC